MKKIILLGFFLAFIWLAAFYLRTLHLPDNLLFGYEQGRDAIVAKDILSGNKFTLLGPQTDIQGLYHGVGYYYILSAIYFFTQADPGKAILVFAAINAFTCIIVFFLAKEIIGKTRYALLAALMTAFSFDIVLYGRWLSNVSFSIPLIALFFYSLTKLVKTKNPFFWLFVGSLSGLLSHFELLHLLFAVCTILLAIKIFALPIKNKQFFIGIMLFILANASFIIFDIRHDFLVTNSVLHYITSQPLSENPIKVIGMYFNGLITTMVNSLFPSNGTVILLFIASLLFMYVVSKKGNTQPFKLTLLMIFFSFPYIFLLKYGSLEHFYAGTAISWIIFFNFLMYKSEKSFSKYAIFGIYGLLLLGNFIYITRHLEDRYNIFYHSVQKNYIYKDQLAAMDYIFSHGKNGFTVDSINIPFHHQHAWHYLYDWYGKKNYPKEYAHNANGTNPKIFLITEPGVNEKDRDSFITPYKESTILLNTVKLGEIEVQERKKLN